MIYLSLFPSSWMLYTLFLCQACPRVPHLLCAAHSGTFHVQHSRLYAPAHLFARINIEAGRAPGAAGGSLPHCQASGQEVSRGQSAYRGRGTSAETLEHRGDVQASSCTLKYIQICVFFFLVNPLLVWSFWPPFMVSFSPISTCQIEI